MTNAKDDAKDADAKRIMAKYPDRVPLIVERAPRSNLPEIKRKFLVPIAMLFGGFRYVIHKHVKQAAVDQNVQGVQADQTIYIFIGNTTPKPSESLGEIHSKFKKDDGYLYVTYSAENTLG